MNRRLPILVCQRVKSSVDPFFFILFFVSFVLASW